MKLAYWQVHPNFGDALNALLWPQILPDLLDDDERFAFFGIGSIIGMPVTAHWMTEPKRIFVVGSGYGGSAYSSCPAIDERWQIYFVRGPGTAASLGIDPAFGIGDPASLISQLDEVKKLPRGTMGPAFMPHWESVPHGNWQKVAEIAGIRYIDPRNGASRILAEIAASTVIVTEAMHGAIVADALRVPWVPVVPHPVHLFKWRDWTDAMKIDLQPFQTKSTTLKEAFLRRSNGRTRLRLLYYGPKIDLSASDALFTNNAVAALQEAIRTSPILSSEAAFSAAIDRMSAKIDSLRKDIIAL